MPVRRAATAEQGSGQVARVVTVTRGSRPNPSHSDWWEGVLAQWAPDKPWAGVVADHGGTRPDPPARQVTECDNT